MITRTQFLLALGIFAGPAGIAVGQTTGTIAVGHQGAAPEISASGNQVMITRGTVTVGGKPVSLASTATLVIQPADIVSVREEETTLPGALPHMWLGGNLRQVRTANAIPGSFITASLEVRMKDGAPLQRGKDYLVDDTWASIGRAPSSRASTDSIVLASYKYSLMRLDGIDVTSAGKTILVPGVPHLVCPAAPPVTTGALRLANIFRPYNSTTVEPWQIFPVGPPFEEPSHAEQVEMSRPVRRTLEKLRRGEAVTIVTWGDSVTVGGDASRPELAYANLFISRLRERFPSADIRHVNAGIGGTNTTQRLPGLEKEVLTHKPDLVTIEFVNDMSFPIPVLQENWNKALSQIKAAGAEAVVITPHFTGSFIAMGPLPRGGETRPQVAELKKLAAQNGVALADTSLRWAHLDIEGIPYVTLLYNGINHPNDFGHELFVKDLMNLFPREN